MVFPFDIGASIARALSLGQNVRHHRRDEKRMNAKNLKEASDSVSPSGACAGSAGDTRSISFDSYNDTATIDTAWIR